MTHGCSLVDRHYPVGAEVLAGRGAGSVAGVHFRVWAPDRERVEVVLERPAPDGGTRQTRVVALGCEEIDREYFSGLVPEVGPGTLYRFLLDGEGPFPDPASRFQPDGPHGPSEVVDPSAFAWHDVAWRGPDYLGQVLYELHVGTFTREGTFEAAARELGELAAAGVTCVELMPVAEFPGRFGWGYDGVDLFAPFHHYGRPDDLRRFVDVAHSESIAVILDAVYNHVGPDGSYFASFSPYYFSQSYPNEWGQAMNFDGPHSGPVRDFYQANAAYWVEEFHMDGLRLDATQQIFDTSPEHVIAAVRRRVREAAGDRRTYVTGESETQDTRLVRPPSQSGFGLDALWNDDFHHSASVALSGHNEAYYTDYLGRPQEFLSAARHGYLFQGQRYSWQRRNRGTSTEGVDPARFIVYLENHDQLANSARGERLHVSASPGRYRAMTALTLLAPSTPMLFQGQEFAASSPFYYFADHSRDLALAVRKGRREFLSQFPSLAAKPGASLIPDPDDPSGFQASKLRLEERHVHRTAYDLHRDLLRLRRETPAFAGQRPGGLDGAVLSEHALVMRFQPERGAPCLLLLNLGLDLAMAVVPEPLLAPPTGHRWMLLWSSEAPRYGGSGHGPVLDEMERWFLPGEAAVVLRTEPRTGPPPIDRETPPRCKYRVVRDDVERVDRTADHGS